MKIGVMGLRPRQIADVRGRKFNGHELSFYEEKSYSPEKVASFVRKVDKVLVVSAGIPIPKRTLEGIPHAKCHHLAGSISTVIRYLDQLPPAEPPLKTTPVVVRPVVPSAHAKKQTQIVRGMETPRVPVSPAIEATPVVSPPPPKRLAADVPVGRQSQYTLPKHDILVNYPNSGGVQDYTILRAAQPGDTIRFARPEGVPLPKWRNRVAATRNGYWRQLGIQIEAHFYEDYVDLVVMRQDKVPQNTLNVAQAGPKERPEAQFPARDMGITTVVKATNTEGVQPVSGETAAETPPQPAVEAPTVPEAPAQTAYTAAEREFWDKVYVASIMPGRLPDNAAWFADEALRMRRERFGQ